MESEDTIMTAVARNDGRGGAVDRKASFIVQEFKKFVMNVVGISETKRYGQGMYDVNGFLILHSGRLVPECGERVERNGIVLDPSMVTCWKNGGEVWSPVSSRIVCMAEA